MERIQTSFNGITTSTAYQDGDCYSLVNLRPGNGSLHPIAPRKIIRNDLRNTYDLVFMHKGGSFSNFIRVKHFDDEYGKYSHVYYDPFSDNYWKEYQGHIHSAEQTGKILSLITKDVIYYMLYDESSDTIKYLDMGNLPELPVIEMGQTGLSAHGRTYYSQYGRVNKDNFVEATKGLVNKAVNLIINGGTDRQGNPIEGLGYYLFDALFIRYAFRLYDGNLTRHSPPVLVVPSRLTKAEEENKSESILEMKQVTYTYDGSIGNDSWVDVYGYKLAFKYDFTGLIQWKDIIRSVDIFISQPLGVSSIENIRQDLPLSDGSSAENENLIKEITSDMLSDITDTSAFYLIRSIPVDSAQLNLSIDFPGKEDYAKISNLPYQEVMSDDPFSHHKYGAVCSYTYNKRLHIGDIKTTFFQGFHPNFFFWEGTYNGSDMESVPVTKLVAEVEIQTGEGTGKVYAEVKKNANRMFTSAFISYPDPRARSMTLYEVTTPNNVEKWRKIITTPLTSHNFLNLAYYLHKDLQAIRENPESYDTDAIPDTNNAVTLSEPGKIKVSALHNPMLFPNENTYQAGNGNILALASNIMNVSDRNYGQHPLYIFCSDGIWSLNSGNGETVYSTLSSPTYYEAPVNGIIGQTPYGVAFSTRRGLCLINANQVEYLSPQLQDTPTSLTINTYKDTENIQDSIRDMTSIPEFKELKLIVYNPYEDELIFVHKNLPYNYVLNLNSHTYYQSTEKIDMVIGNIYPELHVLEGEKIKDFGDTDTSQAYVQFLLRPLRYGTQDIKKLERLKLAGYLPLTGTQALPEKGIRVIPILYVYSKGNKTKISVSDANISCSYGFDNGVENTLTDAGFIFNKSEDATQTIFMRIRSEGVIISEYRIPIIRNNPDNTYKIVALNSINTIADKEDYTSGYKDCSRGYFHLFKGNIHAGYSPIEILYTEGGYFELSKKKDYIQLNNFKANSKEAKVEIGITEEGKTIAKTTFIFRRTGNIETYSISATPDLIRGSSGTLLLYHSDDGQNFDLSRGHIINPGFYKDYNTGLLARNKHRQFTLSFNGIMDESGSIQNIETIIGKEYDNTKMQ